MANQLYLVLVLVLLAAICQIDANKPKRRGPGRSNKKGNKNDDIGAVKDVMDDFRAELDEMKQQCGRSNVHFFFHGEGDDAGHHGHGKDDVHVHVDLHGDGHGDGDDHDHVHTARCQFSGGYARIVQHVPQDKYAHFLFTFDSLKVDMFKVHVHQNGDLSKGCKGLGGHYDPTDDDKDDGDLGTIDPNSDDFRAGVWFNNTKLSLIGPYSIYGRSIIGHEGNGDIVTCCVIGRGADDHDHDDGHDDGHDNHDSHEGHGHGSHGHNH